jgi:proline dehydrogenase
MIALMKRMWQAVAKRCARAYLVGPELEDALLACRWLSQQGFATTIGFWNAVGDAPPAVARAYDEAADALSCEQLDCYLSIKAPAIGYCQEHVVNLVNRAQAKGFRIHFDSLAPETADRAFSMIARALPLYPDLGCTLPSRWLRSPSDAAWAVDMGLNVRVVKGEWPDPTAPEIDARSNFLAVIDRLLGRARHVAVATHDVTLAREAIRRLQAADTHCELELLFGLPVRPAVRVARETGVPVRLYIPYGHAFLPYCLSQARNNPRIFWWIMRDALLGHTLRMPRACRSGSVGSPERR